MGTKLIIPNADFSENAVTTPLVSLGNKTKSKIKINGKVSSVQSTNHNGMYWGLYVETSDAKEVELNVGDNYVEEPITSLIHPLSDTEIGTFDGETLYIDLTDLTSIGCLGEIFDTVQNKPLNNSIRKIIFTGEPQNEITLYSPFAGLTALEEIVGLDRLLKKAKLYAEAATGNNLDGAFYGCRKLKDIDLSSLQLSQDTGVRMMSIIKTSDVKINVKLPQCTLLGFDLFLSQGTTGGGTLDASETIVKRTNAVSSTCFYFEKCIFKQLNLSAYSDSSKMFSSRTKTVQIINYQDSDIEMIKKQLATDWSGSKYVSYDNAGTFTNTRI